MSPESLLEASAGLEAATPRERLAWALDAFGDALLFTSSFGASSAVLLHLWSELAPERPVVFLDTGFHFPETVAYRDRIAARLGLRVEVVTAGAPTDDLHLRDPDACCALRKVAPLAPYRVAARGWVSGLRRDQAVTRRDLAILEPDDPLVRVHPLADLGEGDVRRYMQDHALPDHPLAARRYLSIGCAPCTRPVADGEDPRAGRWAGSGKTECGLHPGRRPRGDARA